MKLETSISNEAEEVSVQQEEDKVHPVVQEDGDNAREDEEVEEEAEEEQVDNPPLPPQQQNPHPSNGSGLKLGIVRLGRAGGKVSEVSQLYCPSSSSSFCLVPSLWMREER